MPVVPHVAGGAPGRLAGRAGGGQPATGRPGVERRLVQAGGFAHGRAGLCGGRPPRSAEEFLRRLPVPGLLEAYQDVDPEVLAEIEDLTRERGFAGVRLRYADYFDALAGRFDGDWSYGDGEVMVLRLPTLAEPEDAAGAFGFLLGTWPPTPFSARPAGGRPAVIIDEFSAVSGGAWAAIDLAERLCDVGVMVTFCAQSWEGSGPELRERLLASCAAWWCWAWTPPSRCWRRARCRCPSDPGA